VAKKEIIEEIFSKALFTDEEGCTKIFYSDFERVVEYAIPEFVIQSNNLQTILISKIKKIMKSNTILFEKNVAEDEQYWEFLKKSKPFKMKWQKLRLTKQQNII